MSSPAPGSTICPRCGGHSPVRLASGGVCGACEAVRAWDSVATGGGRLVIDHEEIRRVEAAAGAGRGRSATVARAVAALPMCLSFAATAAAGVALARYLERQPPGPLEPILDRLRVLPVWVAGFGAAAFVVAVVGLVRLRRMRGFRSVPLVVGHLVAVTGACCAVVAGVFGWLAAPSLEGWAYLSIPPLSGAASSDPADRRMQSATVVVFSPDAGGDMRAPGVGSGAIVATDARRAWILTCSHVAMPYEAVGSRRVPSAAHPVWVTFADGRGAPGRVRWTWRPPLDIALVEVEIDGRPEAAGVSETADALVPGTPARFVPNPMRSGWMVHRGMVTGRVERRSPAGEYRLLHTNLPAQPGDSGSGVYDDAGNIVGITTWVNLDTRTYEAIALPAEALRAITAAIREGRLDRLDEDFPGGILP